MKKIRRLLHGLTILITVILLIFVVLMQTYPEQTSSFVGFRFYVVLTNSMEPVIPTYSLVFSEMIDEEDSIEPDDIVTFKANRFGEDVLLTHYFRKTQEKDGITYYRTQGATATDYDDYETPRSDIVGKYVFHVPYVGKIILFLQSPFGFVMYGELLVIFFVNKLIKAKWEEKEEGKSDTKQKKSKKGKKKRKLEILDVQIDEMCGVRTLTGVIENNLEKPVKYVISKICMYDDAHQLIKEEKWYLVGKEELNVHEKRIFYYTVTSDATDFEITIIKYRGL